MPDRKRTARQPRAEQAPVRVIHQTHQELFDFAPVMWMVLDAMGVILDINPAACVVLGHSKDFVLGTPLHMWTTREDRVRLLDHTRRSRTQPSGHGPIETDLELKRGDGSPLAVRLFTDRRIVEGQVMLPTVALDLTDQAAAERARGAAERRQQVAEAARKLAQSSEAAKDQLLAMVSHELRNPLSPALTAASYLAALPGLPERAREMAAIIKRNIELEVRLIDDLLDVSRVTRGRLDLQLRTLDVHEVLQRASDACAEMAMARGVTVALDLQAARHHTSADEGRLQQVFWNLLSNAIKFSHEHGYVLARTTSDGAGVVKVTVRDHGIGMSEDTLEALFEPFESPSPSLSGRSGLGLGLTIARGIVEAHGGRISASSEGPHKGSLLELELMTCEPPQPVVEPRAPVAESIRVRSSDDRRVLIVEDNEDTGALLSIYLARRGYTVTVAQTLAKGLEALTEPWDAVLSDIGLGDGSGLEIARRVGRLARRPGLVVAVSGFVSPRDVEASRQAGFDCHLPKPVDLERLVALLESAALHSSVP